MKGTKRFGISDSTNESLFQSKRLMVGSQVDFQRAEPSQQQSMDTPPLDMRRAESSRQHVRALNTQFASWVQSQLLNHPDELWEDGLRDYQTHASNIMDKFSDVVNWLKANPTKVENLSEMGSQGAPKKPLLESKDNEIKVPPEKTEIAQASATSGFATSGFATSWSTGGLFNNQAPFSFGLQNSVPLKKDPSNDNDGDDDIEQPSSPSLKKTEEIGITVVHEVKCKLYVKSTDPSDKDAWKDKGTGQLSIKCKEGVSKGTRDSKPTIVVRNDVGRLLLNALLYPGIKTSLQKNSIVAVFHTVDDTTSSDSSKIVARTFLIRTKGEEERNKLAAAIQEYAPAA